MFFSFYTLLKKTIYIIILNHWFFCYPLFLNENFYLHFIIKAVLNEEPEYKAVNANLIKAEVSSKNKDDNFQKNVIKLISALKPF